MRRAWIAVALVGCGARGSTAPIANTGGAPPAPVCLADSLGALTDTLRTPACLARPATCAEDCRAGNRDACWLRARDIERAAATAAEAVALDRRGCALGLANACTNFAAATWFDRPDDAAYECARRIFARSCEVGDHFACGMDGRLRVERDHGDDRVRGRAELEQTCARIGGFPCRILALELERGALDGGTPAQLQELLSQACAGHDPAACGAHATVDETFTGP